MFIGNRKTKTVHFQQCSYTNRMNQNRKICFSTLKEAEDKGYHLCKRCNPIGNINLQKKELHSYCEDRSIRYEKEEERLMIITPSSEWMVNLGKGKKSNLRLYHKNTLGNTAAYHKHGLYTTSLMRILQYIVKHDEYRRTNPLPQNNKKRNTVSKVCFTPKSSSLNERWEVVINQDRSGKTKKRKNMNPKKNGARKRKLETLQVLDMMNSMSRYDEIYDAY